MLAILRSLLISFLLALIALGMVQCTVAKSAFDLLTRSGPIHERLYIPEGFSKDEVQDIITAAQEWTTDTNGFVSFTIIEHFDGNIEAIALEDDVIVFEDLAFDDPRVLAEDKDNSLMTLGFYDSRKFVPTISIIPSRIGDNDLYRRVVAHELGHSFGLDHNPVPGSIMYFNMSYASEYVSHLDIVALCEKRHCKVSDLEKH
jgi:hypothetical protein